MIFFNGSDEKEEGEGIYEHFERCARLSLFVHPMYLLWAAPLLPQLGLKRYWYMGAPNKSGWVNFKLYLNLITEIEISNWASTSSRTVNLSPILRYLGCLK